MQQWQVGRRVCVWVCGGVVVWWCVVVAGWWCMVAAGKTFGFDYSTTVVLLITTVVLQ